MSLATGRSAGDVVATLTKHGTVLLVTLAAIVPLYFMVSTSFKTEVQYAESQLALPTSPTLLSYQQILGNPMFLTWIRNSFILTVLSVSIGITISALAAYALACMDFPGRQVVFIGFVAMLGAAVLVASLSPPAEPFLARMLIYYAATSLAYATMPYVRRGDIPLVAAWVVLLSELAPCFAGQLISPVKVTASSAAGSPPADVQTSVRISRGLCIAITRFCA